MRLDEARSDLLAAVSLLTRVPVAAAPATARAAWAYPVAGLVPGLATAATMGLALAGGLAPAIAGALALAVGVVVTGGLHEDGLADTADGLWGGWSVDRRLEIMRDSRIGSYGVLALLVLFVLRWSALTAAGDAATGGLVLAAVVSRAAIVPVMTALPAVRRDGLSRSVGRPGRGPVAIAVGLGAVAALLGGRAGIVAALAAAAAAWTVAALARARIGGQTGDILGAVQVCAEAAVLVTWSAWTE